MKVGGYHNSYSVDWLSVSVLLTKIDDLGIEQSYEWIGLGQCG